MARKISREGKETEAAAPVAAQAVTQAAPTTQTATAPAKPDAAPLNVRFVLAGKPCAVGIHLLRGSVYYNDGMHIRRQPVIPGRPITVTLVQE